MDYVPGGPAPPRSCRRRRNADNTCTHPRVPVKVVWLQYASPISSFTSRDSISSISDSATSCNDPSQAGEALQSQRHTAAYGGADIGVHDDPDLARACLVELTAVSMIRMAHVEPLLTVKYFSMPSSGTLVVIWYVSASHSPLLPTLCQHCQWPQSTSTATSILHIS